MASLTLTREGWWGELETAHLETNIPHELALLLRGLIGSLFSESIRPLTNDHHIELLKEHVPNGIQIGDRIYEVMVFTPFDSKRNRRFATLVEGYPSGRLIPLKDS